MNWEKFGSGRWAIPDGEAYKRAEKMFCCQQLGMSLREIGEKFGVSSTRVQQVLLARKRVIREKQLYEKMLGLE